MTSKEYGKIISGKVIALSELENDGRTVTIEVEGQKPEQVFVPQEAAMGEMVICGHFLPCRDHFQDCADGLAVGKPIEAHVVFFRDSETIAHFRRDESHMKFTPES